MFPLWSELVLIARLQIPPESMPFPRPKHKVRRQLNTQRIRFLPKRIRMNPLRPNAKHEFHFGRDRPRLLENQIGGPFRRMPPKQRRHPRLNLQPLLDRRKLHRDRRPKARSLFRQARSIAPPTSTTATSFSSAGPCALPAGTHASTTANTLKLIFRFIIIFQVYDAPPPPSERNDALWVGASAPTKKDAKKKGL